MGTIQSLRIAAALLTLSTSLVRGLPAQSPEAAAPRPPKTTIPHSEFQSAFSGFKEVEARSSHGDIKSVSGMATSDVSVAMDTVFVASAPPNGPITLAPRQRLALPMRVGVPSRAATGATLDVAEPFVQCVSAFVRTDAGFAAELLVGLTAADGHAAPGAVFEASFAVLVTGGVAEPNDFTLHRVGEAQRVKLLVPAPGPTVAIAIVALIQHKRVPFDLSLPVQRPVVHVDVSPTTILGLGLGTATVVVQGAENTKPSEKVVLKTTAGTLDPIIVTLDDNRIGTATLRSTGTGTATISLAVEANGPDSVAKILFVMPWIFAIWAVIGGLLGTVLRVYSKKRRVQTRAAQRSLVRIMCTGIGLGFLGAVLWALGLQVLPVQWSPEWSEAAAFAVSALVGWSGSLHFPGSPGKA